MERLTHIDEKGKAAMVDVSDKVISHRIAEAEGFIQLNEKTVALIRDNQIKKGDVLSIAEIAGIQAAKETSRLIPLCHNIVLSKVEVKCFLKENGVRVRSKSICTGQTGVEMEALTAVNIALLTIYDMCKAVDKNMQMQDIKLIRKEKRRVS